MHRYQWSVSLAEFLVISTVFWLSISYEGQTSINLSKLQFYLAFNVK